MSCDDQVQHSKTLQMALGGSGHLAAGDLVHPRAIIWRQGGNLYLHFPFDPALNDSFKAIVPQEARSFSAGFHAIWAVFANSPKEETDYLNSLRAVFDLVDAGEDYERYRAESRRADLEYAVGLLMELLPARQTIQQHLNWLRDESAKKESARKRNAPKIREITKALRRLDEIAVELRLDSGEPVDVVCRRVYGMPDEFGDELLAATHTLTHHLIEKLRSGKLKTLADKPAAKPASQKRRSVTATPDECALAFSRIAAHLEAEMGGRTARQAGTEDAYRLAGVTAADLARQMGWTMDDGGEKLDLTKARKALQQLVAEGRLISLGKLKTLRPGSWPTECFATEEYAAWAERHILELRLISGEKVSTERLTKYPDLISKYGL